MRELKEGALLAGRYVLVRRIGSGGMAEIWRAEDRRQEATVALKFPANPESAVAREQLQKEWRIGSRLMHANIIRLFEYHDDDTAAFYAMQFIGGPDIGAMCGASLAEILGPIGLIADALRYAHAKNLIHRDIKASNILLDSHGIPYLIDFGVAAVAGEARGGGGSRIAASPQQRAGEPPTSSDDIFSLAVLITELITSSPPASTGIGSVEAMRDSNGNPLPPDLCKLLSDMQSADGADRPTAEQVQQRLHDAGFRSVPAPTRLLGIEAAELETVKPQSIRPSGQRHRFPSQDLPAEDNKGGISSKSLYGGLAILLALVAGVIFILPSLVEDDAPPASNSAVQGESPKADSDSAAAKDVLDDDTGDGINESDISQRRDDVALTKAATDEILGDFLSQLERLQFRAIDRWGGQPYLEVLEVYAEADRAYVDRNYTLAGRRYRQALTLLDPFFDRVDAEFEQTLAAAIDAFDNGDHINSVNLYDLAAAISPGNRIADTGLARARNLKKVLDLMEQALQFEGDLELDAARIALEQVLTLDPVWQPALEGLSRIRESIRQHSFEQRMTEGFDALTTADFATASAAFNAAKLLDPESRQPADGLLQVDQAVRLVGISRLERDAQSLEENEEWETVVGVYKEILEIDADLQFARDGLLRTQQRAELHQTINGYIDDPDSLSAPVTMQNATSLLLRLSRISPSGPRLDDQKNKLSRLLKRAATPLPVMLVSDSQTNVVIFRIAKIGRFQSHEMKLRPGVYVAVGSRPGYRDVRIEFRVAPEIEMKPIVVQCEEPI